MDRKIFYAGQVPLSAQFLQDQRNTMVGLGYLAEGVFGKPTLVDGLICTGMTPASLTVQVSPGQIWQLANTDGSAYGTLAADTTHLIMKQGINVDAETFTLGPPGVAGQAINWLIQAQLEESDGDNLVLPYVNSANPSQPFTGPNNSGTSQPTTRKCRVLLSAKAGVAAETGTQVTPAPDAGFVALYSVTVPYGATTLDGSNITQLETAPFLFKKLPELPRWVQSGEFLWGDDTGSKNAIVAKLTPLPTAYKKGMHVFVRKMNAANDDNVTINCNGLGAVAVLDVTGAQIGPGNMTGSMVLHLVYDGTAFRWINGNITNTSISSFTGTSGEGILVGGEDPFPISLNFPGLTAETPTALDLFAFYDNEGAHHRSIKWQDLLALLAGNVASSLVNVQLFEASGTYTKTAGATKALVIATAPGGGGGGAPGTRIGAGGGAGGTAIAFVSLVGVTTVAVTVGAPGAGGTVGNGGVGGNVSFGSYAAATGGQPGGWGADPAAGGGGVGTEGLLKLAGGAGNIGYLGGGSGGNSFWGAGGWPGQGGPIMVPSNGLNGGKYGGGGGGGDSSTSGYAYGGAGGPGCVLVLEFA